MSPKTILFFLLLIAQIGHTQVGSFQKNMEGAVLYFDQCQTKDQYLSAIAKMEELHLNYPNEWLPPYYISLVKSRLSMKKMLDHSDATADEAIAWILKAQQLHNSDEVLCALSLAYTAKMSINPTLRWMIYEKKIKNPLEQAIQLNKNNPRAITLKASLQYKMPILLGGGCQKAAEIAATAKNIFDRQKNDFTIYPHWGRPILNEIVKACLID
jgi:hypothetical protein